ncbi:hypothetical protein QBC39DRAFT_384197 [Podospora conica]|nr:hypothetical protein QBC39DRAFT_384197 [Schizothecium conicum]
MKPSPLLLAATLGLTTARPLDPPRTAPDTSTWCPNTFGAATTYCRGSIFYCSYGGFLISAALGSCVDGIPFRPWTGDEAADYMLRGTVPAPAASAHSVPDTSTWCPTTLGPTQGYCQGGVFRCPYIGGLVTLALGSCVDGVPFRLWVGDEALEYMLRGTVPAP